MNRRGFLAATVSAATGCALVKLPEITSLYSREDSCRLVIPDFATLPFKISLAQWSLNKALFGHTQPRLDPVDFPETARSLGIDAVEYVNTFYRDKVKDDSYWAALKSRCIDFNVQSLLIMCDNEGDLGNPNPTARAQAARNHHKWVDRIIGLGGHAIRVNAVSSGSREEQRDRIADGLLQLLSYAAPLNIAVLVENHGGLSSDGAWLRSLIQQVGHPLCGTLPDFGNFRISKTEVYDRYKGTRELMPFAQAVSAKSYDFDAEGNETTIDYMRMMRIVVEHGYKGFVGIEYEGGRLPERDGILATKVLLERVGAMIASEREGSPGSGKEGPRRR